MTWLADLLIGAAHLSALRMVVIIVFGVFALAKWFDLGARIGNERRRRR
jgi:hypothetical protein